MGLNYAVYNQKRFQIKRSFKARAVYNGACILCTIVHERWKNISNGIDRIKSFGQQHLTFSPQKILQIDAALEISESCYV